MDRQQWGARTGDGARVLLLLGLLGFFVYSFQTIMDLRVMADPHRQESFARILGALGSPDVLDPEAKRWVAAQLWETIQTAFLATTLGAIFAVPLTILSARSSSSWGRASRLVLAPLLAAIRAVHPLFLVILTVVIAGIGPMAGVLALTLFTTAVLTPAFSQYSQEHESLAWPVLLKVYFPGLAFKQLPISMLIASVLGVFGGGGIAYVIIQHVNLLNYSGASVGILACIIAIGSVDLASHAVWRKIRHHRPSTPSITQISGHA